MKNGLIDLAVALLGRAPSEAELFEWWSQGQGIAAVAAQLAQSSEAQGRFDFESSDAELLTSAYDALFGREPDAEGLAYWQARLESGAVSREELVPTLLAGARAETGDATDAALIDQRLEAAASYVAQLESGAASFDPQAAARLVEAIARDDVVLPAPEPGEGVVVQLEKGSVVYSIDKQSVAQDGVAAVEISEDEIDDYVVAFDRLEASAQSDFGTIITFTTGSDVLELVTLELVTDSELRDYARELGYDDWIDMALFNDELVTPQMLGIDWDTYLYGGKELYEYFGYDWPVVEEGPEVITRSDGEGFQVKVELFDTLGVANWQEVFDSYLG